MCLINELKKSKDFQRVVNEVNLSSTSVKDVIQEALQIEREQIELAFDEGLEYEYEHHINGYPRIEPSTYYKETYGGQDE